MSTRATNTTLFFLVLAQLASGFGSYLVGAPGGRWVDWLHAVGGFTLTVLLAWKARVICRSIRRKGAGPWLAPSLLLLGLLLMALVTGLLWSTAGLGGLLGYPAMTVHATAAVLLLPLFVPHVRAGWKRPVWRDVAGRRLLLRRGALALAGTAMWLGTDRMVRLAGLPGAARRFTGSLAVRSAAPNDFPATSWLLDDPDPLDRSRWRLHVLGTVEHELALDLRDLDRSEDLRAVIDCTGGWYADRTWQGVRLGLLLERAGVRARARSVVVRSVTGYWRRLPLAEARGALLATHVDGEPLTHGHGAPLRLVAPGRRGYEWVKWMSEIEVSSRGPLWKWPLPLR